MSHAFVRHSSTASAPCSLRRLQSRQLSMTTHNGSGFLTGMRPKCSSSSGRPAPTVAVKTEPDSLDCELLGVKFEPDTVNFTPGSPADQPDILNTDNDNMHCSLGQTDNLAPPRKPRPDNAEDNSLRPDSAAAARSLGLDIMRFDSLKLEPDNAEGSTAAVCSLRPDSTAATRSLRPDKLRLDSLKLGPDKAKPQTARPAPYRLRPNLGFERPGVDSALKAKHAAQRYMMVVDVVDKVTQLQRMHEFTDRLFNFCCESGAAVGVLRQDVQDSIATLMQKDDGIGNKSLAALQALSQVIDKRMQQLVYAARHYYKVLQELQLHKRVLHMAAPAAGPDSWSIHWCICNTVGYTNSQIAELQQQWSAAAAAAAAAGGAPPSRDT